MSSQETMWPKRFIIQLAVLVECYLWLMNRSVYAECYYRISLVTALGDGILRQHTARARLSAVELSLRQSQKAFNDGNDDGRNEVN